MAVVLANLLPGVMNPAWLTGPIFDKELRVSSRRRRNYALRTTYVLLLTALVTMAWFTAFFGPGSTSFGYMASRMGAVGRAVIMTITWFQFIVAQVAAVLMLSNAISDEIRRGTLDVLLTTPVNSFQIVMGKLLGSLLQAVLLLATSLPLLAIVRVFGGMTWEYVVSSLAVTLTAMILAGSVTMFLSIRLLRPYVVIITMLVLLVAAYALAILVLPLSGNNPVTTIILHINPFAALFHVSGVALRAVGSVAGFSCPVHCLVMLIGSLLFVAASVVKTRKAVACPPLDRTGNQVKSLLQRVFRLGGPVKKVGRSLGQIEGSPIIWRELGCPLSATVRRNVWIFVILLVVMFLAYCMFNTGAAPAYGIYIMGLWLITSVRTGAMAALTISKEREARTWPILLGTELTDRQIVRDKAVVVLWRNLPGWLVIAVNSVAFYLFLRFSGRLGIGAEWTFFVLLRVIVGNIAIIGNLLFLIGAGLYFGMRFKSATAAVVATLASLLGLFFLQRFSFFLYYMIARFVGFSGFNFAYVFYSAVNAALFIGIAIFFLRSVTRRLRKNVF